MQAGKLCQFWTTAAPILRRNVCTVNTGLVKPINYYRKSPNTIIIRTFNQDARATRKKRIIDLRPQAAFQIGKAALAGGAVFGIGALCYYAVGLGEKPGFLEHSMVWPEYVRQRVRTTYMYFGSSLAVTAGAAVLAFRTPAILNLVSKNGLIALGVSIAAMIGSGQLCRSIPYQPGFGPKQMAWILHSSVIGAVLAPMCFLGGPLLIRAAWYTAGVVGGLSTVAACAPSDKFLYMGGPLAMGFGAVFAASVGSYFLPPTGMLGASLYSFSIYGGLLILSGLVLYDTQRIVRAAETHVDTPGHPYDPINMSISIYLDTINIFIRIAAMLAGGGNSKRH